ncbi:hypothetical protein G6F63_014622 [Rhizopus arrhizus]|nr:hypothetical protein G6F63_014622 [Rhizopus arrhizus]
MSRASSLTSSRDFGGMYVSLRNLGPERSLVLIDGRRMGVSAGGYSDLASIPSAIVERVEVLTDGASALPVPTSASTAKATARSAPTAPPSARPSTAAGSASAPSAPRKTRCWARIASSAVTRTARATPMMA